MNVLYVTALCVAVLNALTSTSNAYNVDRELVDLLQRLEENLENEAKAEAQWTDNNEYKVVRYRGMRLASVKVKPSTRSGPGLTATQKTDLLNAINKARREEGAADMYMLHWNDKLAGLAQQWSDQCQNYPGTPLFDSDVIGFTDLGQNIHSSANPFDAATIVRNWMGPKASYNLETSECYRRSCDTYTQLVWSYITDVGCGLTSCSGLSAAGDENFLVCYFGPPGNYYGEKAYTPVSAASGPCSKCYLGQFYCTNDLCDSTCRGSDCDCKANCQNCGTQTSDCRCSCKPGSVGVDCSNRCVNTSKQCGNDWPSYFCDYDFAWVNEQCPRMCKLCDPARNPCV